MAFINYVLRPDVHAWIVHLLYKVPNQKALEALDKALLTTYPNSGDHADGAVQAGAAPRPGRRPEGLHPAVTEILAAQ